MSAGLRGRSVLALLAIAIAGPLGAQIPDFAPAPALPEQTDAIGALRDSPRLQIAAEYAATGKAQRSSLRAGPHEWEVGTLTQQRRDEFGVNHVETQYSLQTGLRWPWKYTIDRRIGDLAMTAGDLAYLDAWHEAGRTMLDLWFQWAYSEQLVRLIDAQSAVVQSQRDAVARRVTAGDAAALELQLADAEANRLRASRGSALRDALLADEALAREFPQLASIPPATLPAPPQLAGGDEQWIARIIEHNHEIELARTRRDEARLAADRAGRDRLADPTVGLHYGDNFGGDRRVIGLSVSVPIGGARRSAEAALARSAARSAEGELSQATLSVEANARTVVADARRSHDIWRDQQTAATLQGNAADITARGYSLGEFDINQMLVARRSALDAQRELLDAHIRAERSYARVLLDAHLLWAPSEHESHEAD